MLAAFVISAVASLMIAFWLPETDSCLLRSDPELVSMRKVLGPDHNRCFQLAAAPKLSFTETLALPSVGRLLTLYFLVFLAFNLFYVNIPVYAATGIQWSLAETGLFFSVLSFLMALVQGPVMTRAVRIWSDRALVLGGSLVLAISFPFFGSANTSNLYAGNALLALGNRLMWPLLLSILARATERNLQGEVQGLASSVAAVASIIGLLVGGLLYSVLGTRVFVISTDLKMLVLVLGYAIRPAVRDLR